MACEGRSWGLDQEAVATSDVDKALIQIRLLPVSDQVAEQLKRKALEAGATSIEIPYAITVGIELNGSFKELQAGTDQEISVEWTLKNSFDPKKAIIVSFDPATGSFSTISAQVVKEDNNVLATIPANFKHILAILEVSKNFTDLKGHWAQKDVELLASRLLIDGVSAGSFDPDKQITRSQFTVLLVRALGLADQKSANVKFTDVKDSDWYALSVYAAVQEGLVNGFEDGTFRPNAPITRSEMAVMLNRALKLKGSIPKKTTYEEQLSKFGDRKSIAGWSEAAVSHMVETGIIEGLSGGNFAPNDLATRAQAAVMLKRMLQHLQLLP